MTEVVSAPDSETPVARRLLHQESSLLQPLPVRGNGEARQGVTAITYGALRVGRYWARCGWADCRLGLPLLYLGGHMTTPVSTQASEHPKSRWVTHPWVEANRGRLSFG